MLYPILKELRRCKTCGNMKYTDYSGLPTVTLEMPREDIDSTNINNLLAEKYLDDDTRQGQCDKCGGTSMDYSEPIQRAPPVLLPIQITPGVKFDSHWHASFFNGRLDRLDTLLALSSCRDALNKPQKVTYDFYRLHGIILRWGMSTISGHYIAVVQYPRADKVNEGEWMLFDDMEESEEPARRARGRPVTLRQVLEMQKGGWRINTLFYEEALEIAGAPPSASGPDDNGPNGPQAPEPQVPEPRTPEPRTPDPFPSSEPPIARSPTPERPQTPQPQTPQGPQSEPSTSDPSIPSTPSPQKPRHFRVIGKRTLSQASQETPGSGRPPKRTRETPEVQKFKHQDTPTGDPTTYGDFVEPGSAYDPAYDDFLGLESDLPDPNEVARNLGLEIKNDKEDSDDEEELPHDDPRFRDEPEDLGANINLDGNAGNELDDAANQQLLGDLETEHLSMNTSTNSGNTAEEAGDAAANEQLESTSKSDLPEQPSGLRSSRNWKPSITREQNEELGSSASSMFRTPPEILSNRRALLRRFSAIEFDDDENGAAASQQYDSPSANRRARKIRHSAPQQYGNLSTIQRTNEL